MNLLAEDAADTADAWWRTALSYIASFTDQWEIVGRILLIVAVTLLVRWVLISTTSRIVARIVSGVKTKEDVAKTTELMVSPLAKARVIQRTRTIGSVTKNVITWTLVILAVISILGLLGFNTSALVASAGIVGVAVSFGAQSLVKDFLTGLFMVFEDQLGVGDFVDLGEVTGTVESVGLRVTQVRGADGTLWYVRNGEITQVGNQSQGWGRAIIEVELPTSSDFEAIEELMLTAAREMVKERFWMRKVQGKPELWGIDSMTGDTIVVKLAIRTRPAQQTDVSRELRLRILRLFEQYHISPAPQQTVYATIASPNPRAKGHGIAERVQLGDKTTDKPKDGDAAQPEHPAEKPKKSEPDDE